MAEDEVKGGRRISAGIIALAIVAVLLAVFIFQNTQRVRVELFLWEINSQLWVILLGTAVVALLLAELATMVRKRRR